LYNYIELKQINKEVKQMEKWLNSLSKKELRTWIKNMSSFTILFFATDEDKQNIQLAQKILKTK
jgi:hypothetical protein